MYVLTLLVLFQPLFQQICLSEALGSLWSIPGFREQEGVLWYYYGDSSLNTLTFHPYSDCGREDESFCTSRSYQPNFTPVRHSFLSMCLYICTYVHHVCSMHMYVSIYMYVRKCVCTYIYICMHVHTYKCGLTSLLSSREPTYMFIYG